jgi:hypothetical protein
MASPVYRGFQILEREEVSVARAAHEAARSQSTKKIERAASIGEEAKAYAPMVLTNLVAMAVLSYLHAFTLIHWLNCRVTTYAIPAAASYAAGELADKIQPVMNAVGCVAGFTARNTMELATVSAYDRYLTVS